MGRWSHSEYDRVLVQKVKALYESCQDALVEGEDTDMRFRTFVKTLNPKEKSVQACFRTLIQQSHYSNVSSSSRAQRLRPISEYIDRLSRSESQPRPVFNAAGMPTFDNNPEELAYPQGASPPSRVHTRTLRRAARAGGAVPAPEVISFDLPPRNSAPPVRRAWAEPMVLRSTESSRAASPSRLRRLGLDPTVQPFSPRPRTRSVTPPTAASQAWLNEYTTAIPNPDPANILPFSLSYEPYEATFTEARARRRRWDEDLGVDAETGGPARRRRLSRGPPRDFEAEMEVQAMFGDWTRDIPPALGEGLSPTLPHTDEEGEDREAESQAFLIPTTTAPMTGVTTVQSPTSSTSLQQPERTGETTETQIQSRPLRRPHIRPSDSYLDTMRQVDAAWRTDQELPPAVYDPRRHGVHLSPTYAPELRLPELEPIPDDVLALDPQESRDRRGSSLDEELWDERMERETTGMWSVREEERMRLEREQQEGRDQTGDARE